MAMKQPFIIEIAKDTYAVNEYGLSTMYVVIGQERALLIDTACGLSDIPAMMAKLTDLPYDVVLTHGHLDHVGGIYWFPKIYVNRGDWDMVRSVDFERLRAFCDRLGHEGGYDVFDYSPEMVHEFTEFPEFLDIEDGFVFDLGGRKLTVRTVAGHTKGGLVLLDDQSRIMFSGDCVNTNTLVYGTSINGALQGFLKVRSLRSAYDQNYSGHVGYAGSPNCFSQPESVPEDLIALCTEILQGKLDPAQEEQVDGGRVASYYGAVRMVYDPAWIIDDGAPS